jgi:serine/threonine-protein kinase
MRGSNHMALQAGTRLGPYEVLSLIGTGGMGEVYRGRDTKLARDVALKILRPSIADDPTTACAGPGSPWRRSRPG